MSKHKKINKNITSLPNSLQTNDNNNKLYNIPKYHLGQYFTTNIKLKQIVFDFILNKPYTILEPCIGQGDLISFITNKNSNIQFDMYEIDDTIQLLQNIQKKNVVYCDFMKQNIEKTYKTIIGNPPYIKNKNGNLYIDFIQKCYDLLENHGELIFIVPSDFLKLTSASKLLDKMMKHGTFTHIFHPHDEKLFENASIDVIIFRYCKNDTIDKTVLYNDKLYFITNTNGLITFDQKQNNYHTTFHDYFQICVGLVSGKENVFKNDELGNILLLNAEQNIEKYIYIEKFPSENEKINQYLLQYKTELIQRKIRKFNENNWFEWGAPRNINTIHANFGKDCIYIYNLTRKSNVAFLDKVQYFNGTLLMLIPKKNCDLHKIVSYMNTETFKHNFMYSGRFKIGHRTLSNSYIPNEYL